MFLIPDIERRAWIGVVCFAFSGFLVASFFGLKQAAYRVETEVLSWSSIEQNKYRLLNDFGFYEVYGKNTRELFIEVLRRETLEAAIRESDALFHEEQAKYPEKEEFVYDYLERISFFPPIEAVDPRQGEIRPNWSVVYDGRDYEVWQAVFELAIEKANFIVAEELQRRFHTAVAVTNSQIGRALEDIETEISELRAAYDFATERRLSYLKEQAQIARSLNVAKNTIDTEVFPAGTGVVATFSSDRPLYLRGYQALETEISLIESRENPDYYIESMPDLLNKKMNLLNDKRVARAKELFAQTPLNKNKEFHPVDLDVSRSSIDMSPSFLLFGLFGGFASFVFGVGIALFRSSRRLSRV